jgi:S-adenosylhomocysteine hydrolase
VPIQLLRAGVRLASVIPPSAQDHVNEALRQHGVPVDLSKIRPEDLDELIEHLQDLTVDVDQTGEKEQVKVRIYCE